MPTDIELRESERIYLWLLDHQGDGAALSSNMKRWLRDEFQAELPRDVMEVIRAGLDRCPAVVRMPDLSEEEVSEAVAAMEAAMEGEEDVEEG